MPDTIPDHSRALKPDGSPYDGIAVHVRTMAQAGDAGYVSLWMSRKCRWCGIIVDPTLVGQHRGRTFDHLVPKADGGGDEPRNLVNSCGLCNSLRDRRPPHDFRTVADMVVSPNRGDLHALGHALLEWNLVREARVAWSFAGVTRQQASLLIHERLGDDAFDPETRKGFQDLASILEVPHAEACAAMPTDDLRTLLDGFPPRSALRQRKSVEGADMAARRNAAARELARRLPTAP